MDNNTQTTSALELPTEVLIDIAVENNEGVIASNGAFSTTTGSRTGRSPNDRFIVREPGTDDLIDWGDINKPFDEDKFDSLWNKVIHTLQKKIGMSHTFMLDLMLIITCQLKLLLNQLGILCLLVLFLYVQRVITHPINKNGKFYLQLALNVILSLMEQTQKAV